MHFKNANINIDRQTDIKTIRQKKTNIFTNQMGMTLLHECHSQMDLNKILLQNGIY